jgi:pyridoxine 4-dehydrogenase
MNSVVNVLIEIGSEYQKSPAQVALNWLICKGAIPIVGVRNEKQAEENIGCIGWRLSEEEVIRLDNVAKTTPKTLFSMFQD